MSNRARDHLDALLAEIGEHFRVAESGLILLRRRRGDRDGDDRPVREAAYLLEPERGTITLVTITFDDAIEIGRRRAQSLRAKLNEADNPDEPRAPEPH